MPESNEWRGKPIEEFVKHLLSLGVDLTIPRENQPPEVRKLLDGYWNDGEGQLGGDGSSRNTHWQLIVDTGSKGFDRKADERVGAALSGASVSADLDGDGRVSNAEKKALDEAKKKQAKSQSDATGKPVAETEAQVDNIFQMAQNQIPQTVLSYTGGAAPSLAQQNDLLRAWNDLNPDAPVSNINELYKRLAVNSPANQNVIEAALYGVDPVTTYTIKLPPGSQGGDTVTVSAAKFNAFQKGFEGDFTARELTTLVRTAQRVGVKDSTGANGWQIMAALARASGVTTLDKEVAERQYAGPNGQVINDAERIKQRNRNLLDARIMQAKGIKFNEGKYIYGGNDTLAFIHAMDPTLAARVANTDPGKLSQGDISKFNQYLLNGGFDQNTLASMGYYALGLDQWDGAGGGRYGGSGGSTRVKPDPVAINQAAKDLYRSLFQADPSDSELSSMVNAVSSALSSAPDDQSVDASARVRKAAEELPIYKELYGNKPAGMSEDEYQGQFKAGAAQLLGNEAADPNTIRSGMRTGNYQTTLGSVAGSKKAWSNSTFLGRLAQAAQIVNENT